MYNSRPDNRVNKVKPTSEYIEPRFRGSILVKDFFAGGPSEPPASLAGRFVDILSVSKLFFTSS